MSAEPEVANVPSTQPREARGGTTSSQDARLKRIDTLARLMDDAFQIPGTEMRVGWDALIGLLPVAGDAATAAAAAWLVYEGVKLGLPKRKIARMIWNVTLDFTVGAIPLLGDWFDAAFKANRKNAKIVREHFE